MGTDLFDNFFIIIVVHNDDVYVLKEIFYKMIYVIKDKELKLLCNNSLIKLPLDLHTTA